MIIILSLIMCPCCGYLPVVDYDLSQDFKSRQFIFDNEEHNLIETDSVNISVTAETSIPKRYRSRKLKVFFVSLRFDVKKNLFDKSIVIPLNPAMITCSDGTNTITSDARIVQMDYVPQIVIRNQKGYLAQGSLSTDIPSFKFDYSHVEEFNYKNQILKINLGDLNLPDGRVIKSKELVCRFQEKS